MIKIPNDNGPKSSILCPEGDFGAVCSAVYSLGLQPGYDGKGPVRKYAIFFELDELIVGGNLNGERYRLSRIVSEWFSGKSALMETIRAMFTDIPTVERNGDRYFDEQALVGRSCAVRVQHEFKGGDTFARISLVFKHPKGPTAVNLRSKPSRRPFWVEKMQEKALDFCMPPEHREAIPEAEAKPNAAPTEVPEAELITTTTTTALVFDPGDGDDDGSLGPDDWKNLVV